MISIYKLKPKFQSLLSPILVRLYNLGVTANQITLFSIILSLIIGLFFWYANINSAFYLALPIGLFVRMALNALDGMMAKTYNQQSKIGEILNEIGDIISDLFIFFPLLKYHKDHIYIVTIFICLSIINEYSGILGKAINGNRRYEGPMGKSDRAFIIGLYGLLSFLSIDFSNYFIYAICVTIFLLLLSTGTRIYKTIKL